MARARYKWYPEHFMRLTLQSQLMGDVVVIRCEGRIVAGAEVEALQNEFNAQTKISGSSVLLVKKVVLQLAGTDFIDSSGLGALVHMSGVLKAAAGELKLCELSPFVLRVLQVTNLLSVFHAYASEKEAMGAFSDASRSHATGGKSETGILCIDPSSTLLAYISVLMKRSDYTVHTTRYPGEIMTLVTATMPRVVISGPGVPDFSTAEAGQAGVDLVKSVKALLTA
jgi:anti-sigma B factor antagonist